MGSVTLNGATSGSVTVSVPAVAGTNTATLPAGTGTIIETVTNMAANPVTGTPSSSNYLRGDGTWATISTTGLLIRAPQVLTTGTSYTTPSNCTSIYVEAVGGGASGRGVSSINVATGGGAGAYCAKYFTVTGSTAYTYAIGAGGAGTNGNSGAGGNTTFTVGATTITAGGGAANSSSTIGGSGGSATNGDINSPGGPGGLYATPASGVGANSFFAGGGTGRTTTGTGGSGTYGSGGGGGAATTATNGNGGDGGTGLIRIWEYT